MKSVLMSFVIVIVLGVMGIIGYSLFTGENLLQNQSFEFSNIEIADVIDQVSTSPSSGDIQRVDSDEIYFLFKDVSSVSLDPSLVRSPAFESLESISVAVNAPTDGGRQNPFLPIGIESSFEFEEEMEIEEEVIEEAIEEAIEEVTEEI
jgi:DNA-binding protein YbaB